MQVSILVLIARHQWQETAPKSNEIVLFFVVVKHLRIHSCNSLALPKV